MNLVTLLDLGKEKDFPRELEERINDHFESEISSSDTYHRYYPDIPIEGLNEWLINNGLVIDTENEYFHILIRISW